MASLKVWQHRNFKYVAWPFDTTCFLKLEEHVLAVEWLTSTLKKSHYRINFDKRMFKWYPNSVCMIDYHFKHEGDLIAFKIKFPAGIPTWP